MWAQQISAEELAQLFHHYHQALGTDFGCEQDLTPESWDDLPQEEKRRAVAAARLTLLEIASTTETKEDSRRYFAKPGEAEWGC
jgi:hypothetical protein